MTIKEFIEKYKLRIESEFIGVGHDNPEFKNSDCYKVTISRPGHRMTFLFYHGIAIKHEPTLDKIIECLQSDASCADYDFEEFCSNLGYDEDNRRAERIYKAIQKETVRLKTFFGDDLFTIFQGWKHEQN